MRRLVNLVFSVRHPPECLFYKSGNGCRLGEKCSYAHRQVISLAKGLKIMVTKVQWLLKITQQLGFAFQDMEPPKSSSILRKSSNILKPVRCVRFTEAVLRHADIRDQNPSLGMICPGDPHQRNPMLQNLKISLKKRRNGKSDVPGKQRGRWLKAS